MRCVTAILSVAAVVLIAADVAAQAKPSFAGEWKIDGETGRRNGPGVDLTIKQDATTMTVDSRAGGLTVTPVKVSYNLSKAIWAGNNLVVTTTTSAGDEKRTFSMDGDYLVVETSAPARGRGAPTVTKVTYKRYERGAGG